ncbi:WXG100 family type VII secretion target [Catenuloplanes japonicus]|uniref:WXG100 family type VII secretion target n=1 Tax=Catenuloplanes japonicus TaxID=33876 RepID=UPI0005241FE7|nr:WXG100 family type VII secretion target [Catenuloplanes japonicus]
MSEITRVQIPEVNGASTRLDVISDQLETAVHQLKRRLEAVEGCWGDDEAGKKFAEGYLPKAQEALENGKLTPESLATVAENLRMITTEFAKLDQYGADKLIFEDK